MSSNHRRNNVKFFLGLMLTLLVMVCTTSVWSQDAEAPAPAPPPDAAAAAPDAEAGEGGEAKHAQTAMGMIWEVAKTPPYVFFLLVACSILTLTLIIERYLFYSKADGKTSEQLDKVKQAATISDALNSIQEAPGVSGRIFRMALTSTRDGYKPEEVERLVEGEVTKELIQMEKFLPQLDSMVTLCPLMGLLGTTVGMIKSFSIVATIGMSDPSKLAGGISEALINTATGLAIAIPALFAYNWFTGKKEAILMDMERGLSELMVILKSSQEG